METTPGCWSRRGASREDGSRSPSRSSTRTSGDLYIHTVGLTDPPLGEFLSRTSELEPTICGREIAVNRRLPRPAEGVDFPVTTIALMLDDPTALIDEIGLAVALSRRSDWSDCAVLSKRTHVWVSPM